MIFDLDNGNKYLYTIMRRSNIFIFPPHWNHEEMDMAAAPPLAGADFSSPLRAGVPPVSCQATIQSSPPPYHTFEVLGEYFVFDTSSRRFYGINKPTYRFLEILASHEIDETKLLMAKENEFPPNTIDDIANGIEILLENGLADIPDYIAQRNAAIEEQRDLLVDGMIRQVELIISDMCNMQCVYCFCERGRNITPGGFMDKEAARKSIDFLFSQKPEVLTLIIIGGEPLANREVLRDAVVYAREKEKSHNKKLFISLTTNATLIEDDDAVFFAKYGVGIMVSLDGPMKIHDANRKFRGNTGSFEATAQGLERLIAHRCAVSLRGTIVSSKIHLHEMLDFYARYPDCAVFVQPSVNSNEYRSDVDFTQIDYMEFMSQSENLLPILSALPDLCRNSNTLRKYNYYPYTQLIRRISGANSFSGFNYFRCTAVCPCIVVDPAGYFYPCLRFGTSDVWRIGSLNTGLDLKICKNFWDTYHADISETCKACWAWPFCLGPCPAEIKSNESAGFLMDTSACCFLKRKIEHAAYLYLKEVSASGINHESTDIALCDAI